MNGCATDSFPVDAGRGEMIHLRVEVNPTKGTGTAVGTAIFEDGQSVLGVCELKFKRQNTSTNPNLPLCPP